jgi:hypothetical protein
MMRLFQIGSLATVLILASCGGGGGGAKDPGATTDPGIDVPADVLAEGTDPGVVDTPVSPDKGSDPGTPTTCDPACTGSQYCDLSDMTCKSIVCSPCTKSKQCGADATCTAQTFSDGSKASICSKACKADADCGGGFSCSNLKCLPKVPCPAPTCDGAGKAGDPCAKDGIHAECGSCDAGLTCAGQAISAKCETAIDCVTGGLSPLINPVCQADGTCAYTYCTSKCAADGTCPDGFGPVLSLLSCFCEPVGTAKAGAACPIFNVNPDAEECGAKLTCLGIPADDQGDTCAKDEDCASEGFLAAGDCVEGRCGLSFCSPRCAAGVCADGFAPIDVSGTCFCGPVPVGKAKPGEACKSGDVHPTADHCAGGSVCFAFGGGDTADDCAEDKDCPKSAYYGNPTCVNKKCATSFCSPYCDAKGECGDGFVPEKDSLGCFCIPHETGSSKAGDGCPFGDINPAADYCQKGLSCLAFTATETSDACTTEADCAPSLYLGKPACVKGKCTSSFCSGACDDKGGCDIGFMPIEVGDAKTCYCAPKHVGTASEGEPCPIGKVNAEANGCKAELDCVGSFSDSDKPDKCTKAEDCPADYKGTKDCVDGECASTFCAARCDADKKCPTGFEPWGDPDCFCAPIPPPPACADTCKGCCNGEECLAGDQDTACGTNGKTCIPCGLGQTCSAGACACKDEDHKACGDDGNVHWFDSCGVQGALLEECTGGKKCGDGACGCTAEDHKGCVDNNVYWFDSCGVKGAMKEECTGGKVCEDTMCLCKPEGKKGCGATDQKVYWFDTCGVQGAEIEDCAASNKTCKDGACT